jgi:hypothetical protein
VSHEPTKKIDRIFEPSMILPSQFFGTVRRQAPAKLGECQLLIAVLEDAVHCFQRYVLAKDRQGQRLFREAEAWMMSEKHEPGEEPTLSFEYVCDTVGVDPLYLRGGLQRWRERRLAACGGTRRQRSAA